MKTTHPEKSRSVIDMSKMSAEERAALELAEASRVEAGPTTSLGSSLFMGKPAFDKVVPFPAQTVEDEDQGDAFLRRLEDFLENNVDSDEIDRTGEIPEEVIEGLAKLGAFGIKIPTEYGGLGLSQTNYSRAAMLLGKYCGNLTALLSAHQSIGVPQPLMVFGTEEQKRKFLPRCAAGEISAFALTESNVGSDPAKIETTAAFDESAGEYIINGEKLWCTNGVKAGVIIVMARMAEGRPANGRPAEGRPADSQPDRPKISAFIVEMDTPGVEVTNRCHFMGLKALYNGVVKFANVRVPQENLVLGEGRGLKVALTTLNTGRITLPAACVGMAKRCLEWSTEWAGGRVQWGAPVGRHDAVAQKLAKMKADTFAIEAMVRYVSLLVDRDKNSDIRIEAAFAKMWGTEHGWDIVNDAMQIRGGRGYETAESLKDRGDKPVPVERFLRDSRINTIFEGSSEIMRLLIAREALDPHLKVGGPVLNTTLPMSERLKAVVHSAWFYGRWYPMLWMPALRPGSDMMPEFRSDMRCVRKLSKALARKLFHSMIRFGPKLEKKQVLLGRFVEAGAELFAMTASVAYAQCLIEAGKGDRDDFVETVRYFCKVSRVKVDGLLRGVRENADTEGYQIAKKMLE